MSVATDLSKIEADEFLRGGVDCRKGVPHKPGQSEAYDRGYSAQYTLEQNMTYRSEIDGPKNG